MAPTFSSALLARFLLGVCNRLNLLSGTGVCYIFIQYVLLTQLVDRRGFYGAMRLGALLSVPLVCLLPLSLRTNRGALGGRITWSTSGVYAVARAFSSVTFSTITMTTNRTVPARHRAHVRMPVGVTNRRKPCRLTRIGTRGLVLASTKVVR